MELKLITTNCFNEGSDTVAFSKFVDALSRENYLEDKDVLKELNSKLDELDRRLIFENEPVFQMVLDTQGIGRQLTKMTSKEIIKKYSLDWYYVETKKVSLLKREKFFIKYILQALTVFLFQRFGNRKYYEYELLLDVFGQKRADFIALLAERNNLSPLVFDRKHFVFYSPSLVDWNYIIASIVSSIPSIVSFEDFEKASLFIKKTIEENWSKGSKYYLKKGLTELKMTMDVLEEKFPRGYHIQNDFTKLCNHLKKAYGDLFEIPASGVITWKLQKDDRYCQIDRGKYLPWSKCPELNLLEQAEIINYIQNAGDLVHYATILEHFKDEFKSKGIDNQYFVKGVIDHYLDGYGYEKNRDCIKTQGSSITAQQAILQKIKEFDGVFTIQQLRNLFPGVKDYTFQIVLLESDDTIALGNNRYVSLANSGMTEKGEEMVIREALNILNSTNGGPLMAKKILSKIKLFNENYKSELGFITTPLSLYHFLMKSEKGSELFAFKSPYIALKGTDKEKMNVKSSLRKLLSELDEIDMSTLKSTVEKLGAAKNYPINFIDIIEDMSDEFLLVDRYRLIKTSKVLINKNEIDRVKTKILSVITKKKEYNSETQQDLKGFPKEAGGFEMNKYLILGIVLTYLQNQYECELIAKGGKKLCYVVREV